MGERCGGCRHAAHEGECLARMLVIDKEENTQTWTTCDCGATPRQRRLRAEARKKDRKNREWAQRILAGGR